MLRNSAVSLFCSYLAHLHTYFYMQSLTTLNLSSNEIEYEGIQRLADAMKDNKVNFILS